MEFSIQREVLLKTLQQVVGIVEKRQAMPILTNVLLRLEQDRLLLTATDLEIELIALAPLEQAVGKFEVTIPARKLLEICRALPEQQSLKLNFKNQSVIVKTSTSKYTLTTLSATDFPNIEEGPALVELTMPKQDLHYLFHRTHFAIAQQDVRYYLNGVLLELQRNTVRAVATDGHRLAICTYHDDSLAISEKTQIIVPRKAILESLRLLDESSENVSLAIGRNHLKLLTSDMTFTSKLIDGRFPEFDNVLPKGCNKTLLVDHEALKKALTRSAILCSEKFRGIRLFLQDQTLRILASNPDHEEAEETLAVDYQGDPLEIGFNVRYLLDVLNVITGQVKFSLKDAQSSVLIEDTLAQDTQYVVMPMRL